MASQAAHSSIAGGVPVIGATQGVICAVLARLEARRVELTAPRLVGTDEAFPALPREVARPPKFLRITEFLRMAPSPRTEITTSPNGTRDPARSDILTCMSRTRMRAIASPSPWDSSPNAAVDVTATARTVTLSADGQQVVLSTPTLSGAAGLGVLRLTAPELPQSVELDFRDGPRLTIGAGAWAQRYAKYTESGFRDLIAALEAGGARLSLHGVARAQRGGQNGAVLGTAWLLALFEGGVAGFCGDYFGRIIGGHTDHTTAMAAAMAPLFAILAAATVFALPWHALVDATRTTRTPTAHFDDMSWGHGSTQALWSAMLPFIADPPAGAGRVYVVLPWRPPWRLPAMAAFFVVGAAGSAIVGFSDSTMVGGPIGAVGRLGIVAVAILAYYRRGSGPVAVDLHTARRVRKGRTICYAAALLSAIALGVLNSLGS